MGARRKTMSVMSNGNAVTHNAEPMRGHHQRALRVMQGRATDHYPVGVSVMPHA